MARKRLVSPGFFTHGALYDAEAAAGLPLRLAFAGLWTVSDRRGVFEWNPRVLKLAILPYDAVDFDAVLGALRGAGFVEHYVVGGKAYGAIPSFHRWQTFHKHETKSDAPDPPGYVEKPAKDDAEPAKGRRNPTVTVAVTGTAPITVAESVQPSSPPSSRDDLAALLAEHAFGAFTRSVDGIIRSARSPLAVMSTLRMHLAGELGHELATVAQLGLACQQYLANGEPFNARFFAGFVRDTKRGVERTQRRANDIAEQSTIDRENKNRERSNADADAADRLVRDYERAHPSEYAALLASVEKTVPEKIQAGRDVIVRAQLATLIRREAA